MVMTHLQKIQNRACRMVFSLEKKEFVQDKLGAKFVKELLKLNFTFGKCPALFYQKSETT